MRRVMCAAVVAWLATTVSGIAVSPSLAGERKPHSAKPLSHHASTRQDLRIGLLLAGGPHGAAADDIAAGLDLALAEANRTAGGRHLVVVREDGDGGPTDSAARAQALAAAGAADVFVGPATRTELPALREAAAEVQVPLIVPVSEGALAAQDCSPYVFNLVPADDRVAGLVGAWIGGGGAGRRPAGKHAYVLVPDDKAARANVAAFERQFEAAGGEIVGEESVSGSDPEFSAYLAKLRLVGADTMYAPFTGAPAKALASDFKSLGLETRVTVVGGAAGPAAGSGGIRAVDYVPGLDTPENQHFRTAFETRFGRAPSPEAARGYDAGRMIVEALRTAHGQPEQDGGLATLLAQVSFTGPRGAVRGGALEQLSVVDGANPDDKLLGRIAPTSPAPADSCHAPARS
ncbi:MAG: ABC transporter substrate-binding protein [Alphaproteobacteria bacterium]|nr:ABC transporter substrate-binding protein [Alphaproteobacteria bacterium]